MTDPTEGRLVVVGAGIAGVSAAAGARTAGFTGEIILLGAEDELPYRRPPVSKEIVRGDKGGDDIRIKKAEWYDAQQITLRTGTTVSAIDTAAHTVTLADGEELGYDSLVLATGGRARPLSLAAHGGEDTATRVRTLRDLADADALAADLRPESHVLVVGAGLIGSEIAANARAAGAEVTVLEAADRPMPHVLPPVLGQWCVDLHLDHGTELHTGVTITEIRDEPRPGGGAGPGSEQSPGGVTVRAEDGRTWSGTSVVLAIGQEPGVELAQAAGLDVASAADGGGIVVDEVGHTSAPDVWAAGDVARMPNDVLGGLHRVEHWQNAQNHGTAVGKAVAGQATGFHEVPWCWSDQYGLTLQVTGWPSAQHEVVVRGSLNARDFTAFFLAEGVLRGAVTVGRPREVRTARSWIAEGARPDVAVLADDEADLADALVSVGG
ncbi:NAD(P)/FAD-dependent oxidoreductase [Aeromicrobium sp. CTD01-1L150]|uniref:NAD(P)/FAD-dependent oxidoreductase n=1 Tax=Aeromicrobium sp. CTD01-1L150 TaxID=3341830 RepID=UPI0035BFCEC5